MSGGESPDPAAVDDDPERIRQAFFVTYELLFRRIGLFTALRLEELEQLALQKKLDDIGSAADRESQDTAA